MAGNSVSLRPARRLLPRPPSRSQSAGRQSGAPRNHEPRVTTGSAQARRSQADRSATTRAKVLDAAREILCAQGYTGATMNVIRDAAGMSLGAIQHQFPTKAKLMAAVIEDVSARRIEMFADAIRRGRTPRESMENLIDANLELISRPESAAALEIHLARRNDPELDREVEPNARRLDRRVRRWGERILSAAGIRNEGVVVSVQLLSNAMTYGLTVEYIRNPDKAAIKRAAEVWRAQMLALLFGPD